jgi:hypothetical protein
MTLAVRNETPPATRAQGSIAPAQTEAGVFVADF